MSSFQGAHVSYDGEIVGVAACVNNVVAAFQYGASVLARAKKQREADGATPLPRWLEDSVSEAPDEIEREKRRGLERFGKPYEIGDDQAIFALQQITIQLQCSLLMKIVNLDDQQTDFKALARAADQARDGTITTLMALRRRLGQAEIEGDLSNLRISTEVARPIPPPMVTDTREVVVSPVSNTDMMLSPSATVVHRGPSPMRRTSSNVPPQVPHQAELAPRDSVVSRQDSMVQSLFAPQQEPAPRRQVSLSANIAPDAFAAQRGSYASSASSNPPPPHFSAQRSSTASQHDTLSPSSSVSQRRSSVASSTQSNVPSFHSSQAPEAMRANSVASASSAQQTRTTMPPITAARVPSSQLADLPKPNKKNNYLGFCKCAWRLQGGDEKAFIRSKDWAQRNASSTVYSLACDKFRCEFKSPFKSSGNPNVIWNKVITDENHGIKYRWSFLAKSHVSQHNVVNEDYSYQCQFCVFMGLQVPVMNLTMLLEHIASDHRTTGLSDVILDRTSCVNDRICRDGEKFDINLYPPLQGAEADAFITPVYADIRDPLWRPTMPVEKYGEAAPRKPSVFELYG